jgi:hypothetical protein
MNSASSLTLGGTMSMVPVLQSTVPDPPYPESLGTVAFQISGFQILMQRNFNTDKINNKNYMLR